jgi:hypothetical protein
MDTWILRMCRRACVRQLLAWGTSVVALLVIAAANVSYIRGFISGPRAVGEEDLDRAPGYLAIGLTLALLALLAWKALPVWRQLKDLNSHRTVARVARWGDPVAISAAVEREWQSAEARRADGWRVTDNYLIQSSLFGFDLLRFADLLWAYKRVTKHSVNLIPAGKTYAAVMVCYGGTAELPGSRKRTDEFLKFAANRAPWAVFGYTDDVARAFNNSTRDFSLAVEQRKRQLDDR